MIDRYLKLFDTTSEYEQYVGGGMIIPNVSYCENDDIVKYSSDEILMTTETNPEVLAICYAKGWCHNPNFMTKTEASLVTNIGSFDGNKTITHFEELEYFNITSIATACFRNTKLTSITIPSKVTSIGSYAFYNCASLQTIYAKSTVAPTITNNSFQAVKANGTLYVPIDSSGYNTWMSNGSFYLGQRNWTMTKI